MIGQFAVSKAGHDKGALYVVVGREGDFVYLSDGRRKPPQKPKKKRLRHIQPVNATVEGELLHRLLEGGNVYGEEIRHALKRYCRSVEGPQGRADN